MAMIELGVGVTGAAVGVMAAEFGRTRQRGLPAYGWAGLAILAVAEVLMFRGIEPVATYFTPIAWTAYILVADAAVRAIRGRSRLANAPVNFIGLVSLSIPLWLTFEVYNLHLQNWTYVGVPKVWTEGLLGYAWSFATIWPGIFETADLIEAFGWFRRARPIELSLRTERILAGTGAVFLVLPVVLPQRIGAYLFALVWLGFALLLDPVNRWKGWPSILGDFRSGRRGRLWSLLISGFVCGWLWEFWNYWAAAKWHYIFPMFQQWKIFEMPAPGFLGFPPFAVECFTMYVFAAGMLKWRGEE
jgi:hypothetical protein